MKTGILLPAIAAVAYAPPTLSGHETGDPVHDFFIAAATAENRVSIRVEGGFRIIDCNGWPDHAPGEFPRRGNPNTAAPQDYHFRVPLQPKPAAMTPVTGRHFYGVALNGVPFEPGTAETWNNDRSSGWRYEAKTGFMDLGLDDHNAHVQPNGAYHYHGLPTGLLLKAGNDGKKMTLIGYAADGFPLYSQFGHTDARDGKSALRKMRSSYRLKSGKRLATPGGPGGDYDGRFTEDWEFVKGLGDLDEANGRFGVTPEYPQGTYHYHVLDEFPFVGRLWRAAPHESFQKAGPGPGGIRPGPDGPPSGGPAGRRPPPSPIVEALDANHDGQIDSGELSRATESLRKLDKNRDGRLTGEEMHPPRPGGAP